MYCHGSWSIQTSRSLPILGWALVLVNHRLTRTLIELEIYQVVGDLRVLLRAEGDSGSVGRGIDVAVVSWLAKTGVLRETAYRSV